ncbi:MAG: hybrid sensor histidine kinase/response regulator [Phycisphaerae bacterium]
MNQLYTNTRIMIIDDEPENLNVLGEMLRHEGLGVRAFLRGDQALMAAREEPPDLLLLDIRMPLMDGYEVCRQFKNDALLRAIPVIFLSAYSEPSDKVRAFDVGGVDYVTKPFAEVEVLARVRTHLQLRRNQLHLEDLVRQRVSELTEAHRRLRLWDEAKDQWLKTLSHEMRTPLCGIFGVTDLLFMDLAETAGNHELYQAYKTSRARIEKLIDDALTLSQIDVAAEYYQEQPLELALMLRETLAQITRQMPGIQLYNTVAVAPDVAVMGDSKLLHRAFHDLVLTATHCVTGTESITLEAYRAEEQVHVVIRTTGKPLPTNALETFFAVGGQRHLFKGGGDYGLSTALASRIIRLLKGQVSVANGSERGITITVTLPFTHLPVAK